MTGSLRRPRVPRFAVLALFATASPLAGQAPDTAHTPLTPITVTATRSDLAPALVPRSVSVVTGDALHRARPTWGLDEALAGVPGVFVANRYNFSLDQRISIRGFGARSAFAVRGVKVLVDGVPQTLPDGQGQLTNLDLGTVERIEVVRGSSSALHGNASGGVISIWTGDPAPERWTQDLRVTAGTFDRRFDRAWTKWQAGTAVRVGAGGVRVTASRLAYEGARNYSAADFRNYGARAAFPLGRGWSLHASADVGDQPKAENPGALTAAELAADRNAAAAANLNARAGKDVLQAQAGLTLRRRFSGGGEASLTAFGLTRDLENPLTFAYIRIDRRAWGARGTATHALALGGRPFIVVAGADFQVQRDDRANFGNAGGAPSSTRSLDQLEQVTEVGPFLQGSWEAVPRVTVTAGARYDWLRFAVTDRFITAGNPDDSGERTLGSPSASAGLTWRVAPDAVLYASAGSSFETPTTTELTNRPTGAGGFNDSLGSQRAWTYEVGVRWSRRTVRADLALYDADVFDGLVPFEVPAAPQRRFFRNAAQSRFRGIEVSLDAAPAPWISLSGTYALSDFRYQTYTLPVGTRLITLDGQRVPGVPVHRGRGMVTVSAPSGAWAEVETVVTSSTLVDDTLSVRAAGWSQVNLRVGWNGRAGGWRFRPFVAVQNAFDRSYVGSVVINASGQRYYEPAPRRNLYFGLALGGGR